MTAFQVRCYSNGAPGKELQTVEGSDCARGGRKDLRRSFDGDPPPAGTLA